MNETVMKGMLRTVKTMVSPEQMKSAAISFVESAIDFNSDKPLEPGEVATMNILYKVNGVMYSGLAILNENNHVTRFENIREFEKVIENFINKM